MQVRFSQSIVFIAVLCCIAFFASCSDDMPIDNPYGGMSGEGISFGVSKDASSWEPDSRALQPTDSIALPCISNDKTFGVSVMVNEKQSPDFNTLNRGTQFTSADTLTAFDVAAYRYKDNDKNTQLYFTEKVNDGTHTSGNTYYWLYEDKIDFLAFAPQNVFTLPTADIYNQDKVTFSYSIDADEQKHRDIMVATAKGMDYDDAGYPVRLDFKHMLASVRFVVGNMQFIQIDSLRIKNVFVGDITFTYDKQGNTWTNSTPSTQTTCYPDFVETSGLSKGSEIAGNVNNATLFMAPQTLSSDAAIEVVYTELLTGVQQKGEAQIGGNGKKWEAGKDYAYIFNIGTTFNVTIPKPIDQDAHYVIFKMDYNLGSLSREISDIVATATFMNDGSNTASSNKWNISLKNSLSETQKQNYFTDEQWKLVYSVNTDGSTSPANPKPEKVGSIVGGTSLSITDNSGSIYLFLDENDGTTNRNGELVFTAKVRKTNQTIVIGRGPFKQLCPSWNDAGIGVERIENDELYPYGFDYSRTVTYTNPTANEDLDHWLWGTIRKILLLLFGATADEIIPNSDGIADGFVNVTTINIWGKNVASSVTLDYGALNNLNSVARNDNGMVNTRNLYNYTGDTDVSELETQLDKNLSDWNKTETAGTQPENYAAYVALCRNRMRELYVEINSSQGTTSFYKAILHKEGENNSNIGENGTDIIEWYLPSSEEAKSLKETGNMAQGISPLNGTYWSSTSGDDANAWAHAYEYHLNNFVSPIKENTPRMTGYKVRAVRKKP